MFHLTLGFLDVIFASQSKHGRYEIEDIFFAGGHGQSGSLYHVSVLTVNEELKLTFHPVSPIVNRETSKLFADAFVDLLKVVSLESDSLHAEDIEPKPSNSNFFPIAASVACLYAIGIHWDAWLQFFSSLATMKENTNPNDFWDALNFWIFFAVAHPILQPALWISEILHGSPGPYVADLIPLNFLLANVAFIAAMIISKSVSYVQRIILEQAYACDVHYHTTLPFFVQCIVTKYNEHCCLLSLACICWCGSRWTGWR